jgi:hypothetical protein
MSRGTHLENYDEICRYFCVQCALSYRAHETNIFVGFYGILHIIALLIKGTGSRYIIQICGQK